MAGKVKQTTVQKVQGRGRLSAGDIATLLQNTSSKHIPSHAPSSVPASSIQPQGADATFSIPSRVVPSPQASPSSSVPTYLQTPPATIGMTSHTPGNSPTDNGNGESRPTLHESTSSPSDSTSKTPLSVIEGCFHPKDAKPIKIIGGLIRGKYNAFWPTYLDVLVKIRERWWIEFKTHWFSAADDEGHVRKLYEEKMARMFNDILHNAHAFYDDKGKKKNWIPELVFEKLLEYWESPEFLKISVTNSANRNHISEEGRAHGKHTCGSRSCHDTKIDPEKTLKRLITVVELFMCTHTIKRDGRPIDDNAKQNEELLQEKVPDIFPFLGKPDPIPDDLLKEADKQFVDCVRGVQNGRIKGLGNLSSQYSGNSTVRSVPSEVLSQLSKENSQLREDVAAMRKCLDDSASTQEKMQEEIARIGQVLKFMSAGVSCDSQGES